MLPRASGAAGVARGLRGAVARLTQPSGLAFAVATCGAAWLLHRRLSQRTAHGADDAWRDLCARLGVADGVTESWWGRIAGHYGEEHRHYHTMTHVEHMLATQRAHASLVTKPATCQLATFFHDVIYDPTSSTNEEDSAVLFNAFYRDVLQASPSGFAPAGEEVVDPAEVFDYIVKTKSHSAPKEADPNLLLFLDFDMAILGTPWPVYADYCRKIRQEFIHVPHYDYCHGRAAVLEKFLQQPVFASKAFRSKFEYYARRNIKREVATLKQHKLVTQPSPEDEDYED